MACVNLIPPPRSRAWVGLGMNVGAEASLIDFIELGIMTSKASHNAYKKAKEFLKNILSHSVR